MGPSGSGKTTLLDVLAGRKTTGEVRGSIKFSGQRPTTTFLRRYAGYVEQFGARPSFKLCVPLAAEVPQTPTFNHAIPTHRADTLVANLNVR